MDILTVPEQAYLCECLHYDPATGILTWLRRPRSHFETENAFKTWNTRFAGKVAGSKHNEAGRVRIVLNGIRWGASRIIWRMMTGKNPGPVIDHKDTDESNNRWNNLREATCAQNNVNCGPKRPGKKKSVYRRSGKFQARITVNNVQMVLGRFKTEQEASDAYAKAAIKFFGEFARY